MNTRHIPTSAELPSSQQLLKSTFTAIATAAVLLVTIVLPSEYAIDLTGIGRALGLTEMGPCSNSCRAGQCCAGEWQGCCHYRSGWPCWRHIRRSIGTTTASTCTGRGTEMEG